LVVIGHYGLYQIAKPNNKMTKNQQSQGEEPC